MLTSNSCSDSTVPKPRLQLSPTIAYYIRKLLHLHLDCLRSVAIPGAALLADDFSNLDQVIVSLYPETQEINSIVHQLEQLTLSHEAISAQGARYLPEAKKVEEKIFWLLGYKRQNASHHGTILIVDDESLTPRLLANVLTRQGYEVCAVDQGQSALKLVQERLPDLILLDVMMPGIDGHEVCKRLKGDPRTQDIPILFVSGSESIAEKIRAFESGAADFLTKPLQLEEVIARIKHQLQLRDRQKSLVEQNLQLAQEVKERRQAEACYRNFFEKSVDGKFQATPDGRYLRVNSSLVTLLGYESPDALLAIANISHLYVQPDLRTELLTQVERCGTVSHFEVEMYRQDKTVIWVSKTVRAVRDDYDNLLFYEGSVKDITTRKQTALSQSQQLLHHLIDQTDALVFAKEYLQTDGSYVLMSRKFAAEFNIPFDRYHGKTDYDFFPQAIADSFRSSDRQVLEGGRSLQIEEVALYQGKPRTLLVTKFPLFNADGQPYAVCGIAMDIHDRKQAASALKASEQLLRQQVHYLETSLKTLHQTQARLFEQERLSSLRLMADIAEGIQKPISFIYAHLSLLSKIDADFSTEKLPKLATKMRRGASQISQLISALQNFSDLNAEEKKVDIHQCIDQSLLLLSPRFKTSLDLPAIEVVQSYEWLPEVKCSPSRLHLVFMHLLDNAIAALNTPNSLVSNSLVMPRKIEIRTEHLTAGAIAIHIIDNGCGIEAEHQSRIFEPFFTTKASKQSIGMGLAICHEIIVGRYHGQMCCTSVPGRTEFTIVLPVAEGQS
jgi:PAS domain S-box-containing protein